MVSDCGLVTAGSISITNTANKGTMSMTISNPNSYPLTVQDIHVVWNSTSGGLDGAPLNLQTLTLVDLFQTVNDWSGDLTIPPASTVIMPANATSTIIFTFDKNYVTTSGNESIVIHLSTPGCENSPIQGSLPK
jgi:hypothetical protein